METIDLVATATQILELLSDQGISGKSLHAYTHTGIGCVIRHFQAKVLDALRALGLGKFSIRNYYYEGMWPIIKVYRSEGVIFYSAAFTNEIVNRFHLDHENGWASSLCPGADPDRHRPAAGGDGGLRLPDDPA